MKPRIAISMGDPHGIGPEVALKAVAALRDEIEFVLLGSPQAFEHYAEKLNLRDVYESVEIDDTDPVPSELIFEGRVSAAAGERAMSAISHGVDLCLEYRVDALVTAPIHKEAIHLAGYDFPGHTEYLAHLTGGDPVMLMASENIRVAVLTTHIPLRKVADSISVGAVQNMLVRLEAGIKSDFGLAAPQIALLGLNPHAGDGGVLGIEESDFLAPALTLARQRGIEVDGPFAADAFFGRAAYRDYDVVLACYHDQGLIPFKTLAMGGGVNVTLGLPIVRTSPDHGTALDIAGKGIAEPDSMIYAIRQAVRIAENRSRS